MNYEEKYKEALERAREQYNKRTPLYDIESIFPELAESEDERIRKWLIDWAKAVNWSKQFTITKEQVITWLEKQKATGEEIIFRPIVGTDIRIAAKQALEKIDIGKKVVLAFNGAYIPVNGKTVGEIDSEYDAWLEKQGDKDPCTNCINDKGCVTCENGNLKETKVAPKFKVGDWILNDVCFPLQIASIRDGMYVFTEGDAISVSFVDEHLHLWTIQDAKDGDVLVALPKKGTGSNEQFFLFKAINSRDYVDNCLEYYCRLYNGVFYENTTGYMGTTLDIFYPATKKQRDKLFQEMKEAGYEWDSEKKELKKIEPKTLYADKVIEWLKPYSVIVDNITDEFKKDFGL